MQFRVFYVKIHVFGHIYSEHVIQYSWTSRASWKPASQRRACVWQRSAIAWNEKLWRKELNRGTTKRVGAWSKEAERVEWWIWLSWILLTSIMAKYVTPLKHWIGSFSPTAFPPFTYLVEFVCVFWWCFFTDRRRIKLLSRDQLNRFLKAGKPRQFRIFGPFSQTVQELWTF